MFGLNSITKLKYRLGNIGSKMKDFAKDMLVVEEP
jgi:hypothetical protein